MKTYEDYMLEYSKLIKENHCTNISLLKIGDFVNSKSPNSSVPLVGFVTKINRVNICIDTSYMGNNIVSLTIKKETIKEFIKS